MELDNQDIISSESDRSEDGLEDLDIHLCDEITESNLILKKPGNIKKPLIEDIT